MINISGNISEVYVGSTQIAEAYIGSELVYSAEPDIVIMTSESNAPAMAVCYEKGWAAHADYMTLKEAKKVTNVGVAFASKSFSTFHEFQYFTGVTSLATQAFKSNTMSAITLPSSLRTIGKQAFQACVNLTQMIIPEGVTTTGEQWLWGCKKIALIDLPSTVTTLTGYGIQPYDSKQVNYIVICRAVTPPTLGSSGYLSKLTAVYVPDDSVDAYKAKAKWADVSGKIYPLSDYNN